jgi:hypothetical protein
LPWHTQHIPLRDGDYFLVGMARVMTDVCTVRSGTFFMQNCKGGAFEPGRVMASDRHAV